MGSCCSTAEVEIDFDESVNFDHFRVLRSIGRGAFGKVCIVERRDTLKQYAMKYINKKNCIESHSGSNTLREQEILAALDGTCPFIVNLWYAFQDPEDLFFVVDYMAGGDLSFHLRQATFDEARMRLYCCEVAVALAYLHKNSIIHRDIKPDNILLESTGHVRVTDFNVAFKYTKSNTKPRALAGTRPYMAPEMLVGAGRSSYTPAVDWWSLGISMYECVVGKLPYHIQQNSSEQDLREYFRTCKVAYPSSLSRDCCHALQQFLRMTVARRVQSIEAMKELQFFKDMDFDAVGRCEVQPSFTPQANLMNCDPMHELEEMIVEPQPLHKKKKRMKKRTEEEEAAVGDDMRNLERNFFTFDRLKGGRQDQKEDCAPLVAHFPKSLVEADATVMSMHSIDATDMRTPSTVSLDESTGARNAMTAVNEEASAAGSLTPLTVANNEEGTSPPCNVNPDSVGEIKSLTSHEVSTPSAAIRCDVSCEEVTISTPVPVLKMQDEGDLDSSQDLPASKPLQPSLAGADGVEGEKDSMMDSDLASQKQLCLKTNIPGHLHHNLASPSDSSLIPLVDASEFKDAHISPAASIDPSSAGADCAPDSIANTMATVCSTVVAVSTVSSPDVLGDVPKSPQQPADENPPLDDATSSSEPVREATAASTQAVEQQPSSDPADVEAKDGGEKKSGIRSPLPPLQSAV